MDTNLYWSLRGTYKERKEKLASSSRELLENAILDGEYNKFIGDHADYSKDVDGKVEHGKRVPYIGWFWRHIEFSNPTRIPIGSGPGFVGFMASNKWDYPQRYLLEDEFKRIIEIIDEAMRLNQQGGSLTEIDANVDAKLAELWEYMQTLKV